MAKTYRANAFTRFGNTMSAALIRLGIAPAAMYLLTVRGRKSGLPRTVPVNLVNYQDHRWLVAPYGEVAWVRNVRAAGEVRLRRAGTSERCMTREATAEEAVPVLRTYLRQVRIVRPYFDVTLASPDTAYAAEAPRHPVFLLMSASSSPSSSATPRSRSSGW
jgi:deazaflavin-dependent oxidoreductase (nitroreductase family)